MKRRSAASISPAVPLAVLVAAAGLVSVTVARPRVPGAVVRNPIWGIEMRVPGFEPADHPLKDQGNFILAGRGGAGACRMNLSLFVAPIKEGGTPEECRRGDIGEPDAITLRQDTELVDQEGGPTAWSLFDQVFESRSGARTVYHQLYGYRTRGDLCFQLHLSSGDACREFPRKAKAVLGSLRLGHDPGATVETADVARRDGGDPRDWRLHLKVADGYLHDEARPNPGRARRFYESALRLGGTRLPVTDRFKIDAGMGVAWLQEQNGREAIPPLEHALQMAQRAAGRVSQDSVRDAVYALASAQALAGEVEASCEQARRWFQGADPAALKPAAKRIRKDARMEALTGSECYRALLSDLGLR